MNNRKNNKKNSIKKNLPNIILVIVFLIGLFICLYPTISDLINSFKQDKDITNYEKYVSEISEKEYEELISDAKEYNNSLIGNTLKENVNNSKNTNYNELLSINNSNIIGYLYISKIDVKLPIFHGTDDEVLQKGVGHLEGSSLPIGSKTEHVVIYGHTGLPSSRLITDLDKMEIGDSFIIDSLNYKYVYEIDQITVVEPNDTDDLEIEEDKQYATIVTCTPYGVNTHRLLVRGNLIDVRLSDDSEGNAEIIDYNKFVPIVAIILITCVVIVCMIIIRIKNKIGG